MGLINELNLLEEDMDMEFGDEEQEDGSSEMVVCLKHLENVEKMIAFADELSKHDDGKVTEVAFELEGVLRDEVLEKLNKLKDLLYKETEEV